jgi:hypothetical protein
MRLLSRLPLLALLALGGTAPAASDDFLPPEELEADHALTFAFPTPHVAWARPYAGGRAKVLFFTRGMGTHPRECVELMQRFAIDGRAAFWEKIIDSQDEHWHGGRSGEERIRVLLAEPWDAFVFAGGVTPARLGNECQVRLLTKIADEGAGLVIVGEDDGRILLPAHRAEAPWALAGGSGAAFSVGKGRALRLPARPAIPYQEGWQARDESWHEALGRAVLWAARKEPAARLDIAAPAGVPLGTPPAFTLALSGQAGAGARLEASIRRPLDGPLALAPRPAAEAMTLSCPPLPAGTYHLDARVVGGSGVVTWCTFPFAVDSPRTVKAVALTSGWAEIGGRLTGSVELAGPALPGETVRLRLLDPQRRELVRQELPAGLAFDLPVTAWMPMLVTVEAQVLAGGAVAASSSTYFNVCKRGRDRFNFLMWDCPTGTLAPYAEQSLAGHGVTLQLGSNNPPAMVAANGISWVPYATRMTAVKNAAQGMKLGPVDWNDQAAVTKHTAELAKKYQPSRQHGVFVYSLGDENDTRGCTTAPQDLAAYREFLRARYPSLAELNAVWATTFAAWDEVGLSSPTDNEEEESFKAGRWPRWYDRQAFKSWNYLRVCRAYRQAFAGMDPQAKTGFEGAGEFARGDDLDGIVQAMDFWSPYPGTADEVAGSIAPRTMPRANWMGYTKDPGSLLGKYWRMVMLGMDSAWWWRWDAIGRFHGWLAPDLRPYPAVQEILDDTRAVREGVGDWMLRSEREHDGIAILYSYPSTFATRIGEKANAYESAHKEALRCLRNLGLEPRYVTDGMLRRDAAAALKPFRTLLLVRADALGEAEIAAIRAVAAAGGAVIGDLRPGVFDDRCRARSAGALDADLGIAAPATAGIVRQLGADAGLAAGAAAQRAGDGSPLLITRAGGKGTFVLLNASLTAKPGKEALVTALAARGHTARIGIAGKDGRRPAGVWTQRWRNGEVELLAVLAADKHLGDHSITGATLADGDGIEVAISLPETRTVFDLRAGRTFGLTASLATTLRPNRVTLFALLPAQPAPARWIAPAGPIAPGTQPILRLTAPGRGGPRPFRVTASVDGRDLPWASCNLLAGADGAEVVLPVAYNDPTGDWHICAHDQLTGLDAIIDIRIGGK